MNVVIRNSPCIVNGRLLKMPKGLKLFVTAYRNGSKELKEK